MILVWDRFWWAVLQLMVLPEFGGLLWGLI